jgi:CheY-like chemotaxis protein
MPFGLFRPPPFGGVRMMQRVLVIDDQSYVRATVVSALRANGFDAVAVESGPAGLGAITEFRFDLAIVDIYMPGMDGIKVIKELRSRYGRLPVIAMSGVQIGVSERTVLDHLSKVPGLSDIVCLRKPFRPNELLAAVQNALQLAA